MSKDLEAFIAENTQEVSFGRDSVMRDVRGDAVQVYSLRAWMTGHVRVPVELLEHLLEELEVYLEGECCVETLRDMLNASKGE